MAGRARRGDWASTARRLAVGGDSAGGTLAAVCAILARDAGLPLALQLLFYPGCAAGRTRLAPALRPGPGAGAGAHRMVLRPVHRRRRSATTGASRRCNAADVEGVAPAWFGLAECDPLVDDGLAYADKLRAAGVAVDLEIYRGVTHEFIKMGRAIPEARQAHADAARALAQRLRQRLTP